MHKAENQLIVQQLKKFLILEATAPTPSIDILSNPVQPNSIGSRSRLSTSSQSSQSICNSHKASLTHQHSNISMTSTKSRLLKHPQSTKNLTAKNIDSTAAKRPPKALKRTPSQKNTGQSRNERLDCVQQLKNKTDVVQNNGVDQDTEKQERITDQVQNLAQKKDDVRQLLQATLKQTAIRQQIKKIQTPEDLAKALNKKLCAPQPLLKINLDNLIQSHLNKQSEEQSLVSPFLTTRKQSSIVVQFKDQQTQTTEFIEPMQLDQGINSNIDFSSQKKIVSQFRSIMPQTAILINTLQTQKHDLERSVQMMQREMANIYQQCKVLTQTNEQQTQKLIQQLAQIKFLKDNFKQVQAPSPERAKNYRQTQFKEDILGKTINQTNKDLINASSLATEQSKNAGNARGHFMPKFEWSFNTRFERTQSAPINPEKQQIDIEVKEVQKLQIHVQSMERQQEEQESSNPEFIPTPQTDSSFDRKSDSGSSCQENANDKQKINDSVGRTRGFINSTGSDWSGPKQTKPVRLTQNWSSPQIQQRSSSQQNKL